MKKPLFKTLMVSLVMGIGLSTTLSATAQPKLYHGLFGKGEEETYEIEEEVELEGLSSEDLLNLGGGLFQKGEPSSNLFNEGFGSTTGGITNGNFNESSPLGSGIFLMLMAGAGYATIKKRKTNDVES